MPRWSRRSWPPPTPIDQLRYLDRGQYRTGGFEEFRTASVAVLVSAVVMLAVDLG